MCRIEAAGARHWAHALCGILDLHRQVAQHRYEEGFEAGARACGPMCTQTGELKMTELALRIFEAGETMTRVADRLEVLDKQGKL